MTMVLDQIAGAEADADAPLSVEELRQLRAILKHVRYDAPSRTLRLEAGETKVLLREDGNLRIEGAKITQVSRGALVLNAATIELN